MASFSSPASSTIVACASAPGRSDRAIVRLSGPGVSDLLREYVRPFPRAGRVSVCEVRIDPWNQGEGCFGGNTLLCPALVFYGVGPATYTGEDVLELVVPGNPYLVDRLIGQWVEFSGVCRAGPGEFSSRAYFHGKLSLAEAEGIAALIAARTEDDLSAARRLALGETGRQYRAWLEELTTLLALVEAGIDFVDQEDVVPIDPGALRARLARLRSAMTALARGELAVQTEGVLPLVVLVGKPNAGKSTLFNALLGRPRSVVAEEVGTTRDVLLERLHLDEVAGPGLSVHLADLPGLDFSQASGACVAGEAEPSSDVSQTLAREALARADAIVHCDPSGVFSVEGWSWPTSVPVLRVRTKADQPACVEEKDCVVDVCALDGWHVDVVRRGIADIALRAFGGSCRVALARHARELAAAVERLAAVEAQIDPTRHSLDGPELIAEGMREVLDRLEHVLGKVTPDEVIGRIFSTFCVGK